jgi:hypothetical protein
MSIKIMTWVWENSPYKDAALLMHLALADWSNDDGICWPSQTQIAAKMRGSVENVRRLTRRMEDDGYLQILKASTGKGVSHQYRMILAPQIATPTECGPTPVSPTIDSVYPHKSSSLPPQFVPKNRQEPSIEQPSVVISINVLEAFDQFWTVYPRKAGKKAAQTAFMKACKSVDPNTIIEGAKRFLTDPNREDEFTPHPTTWINQGRWDDEPLPNRGVKSSGTRTYLEAAEELDTYWNPLQIGAGNDPF